MGDGGISRLVDLVPIRELPFEFNPPRHYIATANNNILPPGYTIPLGYDGWAQPYRVNRIREMLAAGKKFDIDDFVRMQQDVTSSLARRFVQILQNWRLGQVSRKPVCPVARFPSDSFPMPRATTS